MKRIPLPERVDWKQKAEDLGFRFHTMHGEPYWDETSAYAFTMEQIERDVEASATALHALCLDAVDAILASEALLDRLAVPEDSRDMIAASWAAREPSLYGRLDLVYGGAGTAGPAKLLEYNADTPTSLYETGSFQWLWLEDQIAAGALPEGTDQFNTVHEAMVARFSALFRADHDIHFASVAGIEEDFATVEYMAWMAKEAGLTPHYVPLDAIGITQAGQFADAEARVIGTLFKLYPWEDMMRDDFASAIPTSGCRIIEPAWKALLSNKGLLPVLWRLHEGHPNLLPAFFADEMDGSDPLVERSRGAMAAAHVLKPLFSREGSSISIVEGGVVTEQAVDRAYAGHPMIMQAYAPLPVLDGARPVLGAWIVGDACVGLGVREDSGRITQDLSRFKPHIIVP
jgi:glutathionylspermidine synthase